MIEEYAFGGITVDGRTYRSDIKIYPDVSKLFDDLGLSWSALPTGQAVE
jgi:hypothetical protein